MLFKATRSFWEHLMETRRFPPLSILALDIWGGLYLLLTLWMIQSSINFGSARNILLILLSCISWNIYWTAMIIWSKFLVALVCCRYYMDLNNSISSTLIPLLLWVSNIKLKPITVTQTAETTAGLYALFWG